MTDREKIIKGLEHCYKRDKACIYCPYHGECCTSLLARDALAMLKEQEEEISKLRWFIQEPHTATEAWNAYMERRHGGKWDDC